MLAWRPAYSTRSNLDTDKPQKIFGTCLLYQFEYGKLARPGFLNRGPLAHHEGPGMLTRGHKCKIYLA